MKVNSSLYCPPIKIYIIVILETVDINITVVYHPFQNWVNTLSFFQLPSAANLQFVSSLSRQKKLIYFGVLLILPFTEPDILRTTLCVYINP